MKLSQVYGEEYMNRVVVALVTYNRRECLEKTLIAIREQLYKVTAVIIVDNNSCDDTNAFISKYMNMDVSQYLKSYSTESDEIKYIYYRNNINAGGSGGFAIAIDKALQMDCTHIWIMDDDVLPESNCLQIMINKMNDEVKACIPNRTDANFDDHACKRIDFRSITKFRMYKRKEFYDEPLDKEYYSVCDMAFEGPLIAKEVIEKVGLPNTCFFIEYDDTDYAQRILKYTRIIFVSRAILHRQLAIRNNICSKKVYKYSWRNYYSIRNNILFNHMYGQTWGVKHMGTPLLCGWHILRSIRHLQFCNFKIIFRATFDGIKNKTGAIVKPGEM